MQEENKDYLIFFKEIKNQIVKTQYETLKVVNKKLISLYWTIGKKIVENQQKYGWGKSIVEKLSKDLQKEFIGIQGFSQQNLWYMRQFFLEYSAKTNLQPLVGEISWAKHIVIMSKCKDDLEREFYIRMTKKYGWTKNLLIHHIENNTYEKTLTNQTNFSKTVPEKIKNQAKLAVKDEYIFDFLELKDNHSEKELEENIISKINKFLIEMGGTFAFVGNQYRLEVDGDEFFIDILLYQRKLKCLVAVELKIGKFQPEYAGKMQFYLAVLDDKVKEPDENPSIGIILCKDKNRTVVEYALKQNNSPIAVSTYTITSKLPNNLQKELPAPEQIKKLLE